MRSALAAVLALAVVPACANHPKSQSAAAAEGDVQIGYGTQPAEETTGAVYSVDSDDTQGFRYTRVEEMIAARFPGVEVRPDGSGNYTILIRGPSTFVSGTEPLVVIDGVPAMSVSSLATINPNDVARIDVLRDAGSTGIYGSRGANGVILITTKGAGD